MGLRGRGSVGACTHLNAAQNCEGHKTFNNPLFVSECPAAGLNRQFHVPSTDTPPPPTRAHPTSAEEVRTPTTDPLCDIPLGYCFLKGPWTVTRSSLRMLRWVAAFCRALRPVLLLVPFARSRSPVVGVLGLCWLLRGSFDCFCCPHTSGLTPSTTRLRHLQPSVHDCSQHSHLNIRGSEHKLLYVHSASITGHAKARPLVSQTIPVIHILPI